MLRVIALRNSQYRMKKIYAYIDDMVVTQHKSMMRPNDEHTHHSLSGLRFDMFFGEYEEKK